MILEKKWTTSSREINTCFQFLGQGGEGAAAAVASLQASGEQGVASYGEERDASPCHGHHGGSCAAKEGTSGEEAPHDETKNGW